MTDSSTNSRIAIVDDDPIVRDYLIDIVTGASELDVAGIVDRACGLTTDAKSPSLGEMV